MDEWIELDYDTSDEEEKKANTILRKPIFLYTEPKKEINLFIYYVNIGFIIVLYLKTYYPELLLDWL